jgi:hypothetical protein
MSLFLPRPPIQCILLDAMCPTGCSPKRCWMLKDWIMSLGSVWPRGSRGDSTAADGGPSTEEAVFFLAPGETQDPCRHQELVLVPLLVLSNISASHGAGMAMSMRGSFFKKRLGGPPF